MFKKIVICLVILVSSVFAQRRGSIDTGGMFSFQSFSGGDSTSSDFDVRWIVGYHMGSSTATEFEPIINMRFEGQETFVSSILLFGISQRLFDIVPDDYMNKRYKRRELGTTAGVYGTAKAGLWINGYSNQDIDGTSNYAGPAFSLGIGTHSPISKSALLRILADVIYLMPNGEVYSEPRTIFRISFGFSIFVVN